ncbi:DUF2795 domain-containing protein [Streptomyces iconiensis]|uniref:DUF2795 domain-containing protein n=1 Tax=Streptomyces iconiensis TaxID=1384038 RepID=A0ABT7A1Q3_9ACTN|nr:DUF2795 domain-containing protein [Streptomyces iconiensis]MDJ1134548.1 DUF2795 domain-containing protein [Streptomyces iconiensis]
MQENDKNSPLRDDEAKKRLQGELASNREEERLLEPSGEDQPEPGSDPQALRTGSTPEGMTPRDVELRTELAQHLGRHLYPVDRDGVVDALREQHAPDRLVELAGRLPMEKQYANVQEIVRDLGIGTEQRRR